VQKLYRRKAGPLRDAWRGAMSRWIRGATGTSPAARWRTEGETLALWREAGVDVPRDLTAEHPALAGERVRVLEWIEGRPLTRLLAGGGLDRAARDALLARAGAAWGRRQALAAARGDARLVPFHAGFMHLLVAEGRVVAIDLEQAYLRGRAVLPLLARETAACLRTLAKCGEGDVLRADVEALARAHPDPALLLAAAREALRPRSLLRRAARLLDRRRGRKEAPLRALVEVLERGEGPGGGGGGRGRGQGQGQGRGGDGGGDPMPEERSSS
jgi:hypothetical protein